MFNKKIILILTIILVSLFAVSVVSAADNATDGIVSSADNATEDDVVNIESEDLSYDENLKMESIDDENDDGVTCEDNDFSKEVLAKNHEDSLEEYDSGSNGHIESKDTEITYKKQIEYKVRLVGENVNNQEVSFEVWEVDGDGTRRTFDYFDTYSDSKGYATLNANLPWGRYYISTSTWNHGWAENYLLVKPNGYKGLYMVVDKDNYEINYGWFGIFHGYLKIYKGNKFLKKISLNSKDRDYKNNWLNLGSYNMKKFKDGKYTAKIVNSKGKLVLKKSFEISHKSSSKINVKSFSIKVGKKHTIKAFVKKNYDIKIKKGVVKFKINGKTYKTKVKKGVAKITIIAPKTAKTYTCKVTFLGDKHTKKSSKIFKIIVKNPSKKKTTKKATTKKKTIKKKSNGKKITLKLTKPEKESGKHVKKAYIYAAYGGIYGSYVRTDSHNSLNGIKLIKAKVYFKNKYNGKIKVKTKKLNKWGMSKTHLISGYKPYKVVIFYK